MNGKLSLIITPVICFLALSCTTINHLPHDNQESALRQEAVIFLSESRLDFNEWHDARLSGPAYSIYRPDMEEVAYYEFPVIAGEVGVPAGFIMLSTGPHDYRIAQWSTKGKSNCQVLQEKAATQGKQAERCYMLDVFSFAVHGENGELIAHSGEQHIFKKQNASLKYTYDVPSDRSEKLNVAKQEAEKDWQRPMLIGEWCGNWQYHYAGSSSDQRYYRQINPNTGPNTSNCLSGCGATAWAMLFGWADYRASQNDPIWNGSFGIYGDARMAAPRSNDAGVEKMIWEIRNAIQTRCVGDQGFTWPKDMENAREYLGSRTNSSPSLTVHYSPLGKPGDELRDRADDAIRSGRPVVIQLGWQHYALAWGYRKKACRLGRDKHEFFINTGYGDDRWTSVSTALVGQIQPYATLPPPPTCPTGKKLCYYSPKGQPVCVETNQQCPPDHSATCPDGKVCCEPGLNSCQRCVSSYDDCIPR